MARNTSNELNAHDYFNELADLYWDFANDPSNATLARRLGAPTPLDADNADDLSMIYQLSEDAEETEYALKYLALLERRVTPDDGLVKRPVHAVPKTAVVVKALTHELAYLDEHAASDRTHILIRSFHEKRALCATYLDLFGDATWVAALPAQLS